MVPHKPPGKVPMHENTVNRFPRHWFRPEKTPFIERQGFSTLSKMEPALIRSHLDAMVPFPDKMSVLEVGPGISPATAGFPFRHITYLEPTADNETRAVMSSVLRFSAAKKAELVMQKLQAVDFGDAHYDLAVMSEILTHVPPKERLKCVSKVAMHSGKLLIVDRYAVKYPEGKTGPVHSQSLVNPHEISIVLKKLGFQIGFETTSVKWSPDQYFILKASKGDLF